MVSTSDRLPCVYEKASWLSKRLFFFPWDFFLKNRKNDLEPSDLNDCPRTDTSQRLGDKLETEWEKELLKRKDGKKPSLFWTLVRAFGLYYCGIGFILAFFVASQIAQSLCLGKLIRLLGQLNSEHLENPAEDEALVSQIYWYAGGIIITQILWILTNHPYWFEVGRVGMWIRVACCNLVYKKSLKLSAAAFRSTSTGQIVNLVSNDVNRFDSCLMFPFYMIVGPLSTLAVIYILWEYFGAWTLAGISILILYVPLQTSMGKYFSEFRLKTALLTDERVRLMNEFIPAMRVIKMYTWETPFAKLVDDARRKEVSMIKATAILKGINIGLFWVSGKIIVFVIFVTYALNTNQKLTAEAVFVSLSLVSILRSTMTLFFPFAVSLGAEALISIQRIQTFLMLPENEAPLNLEKSSFPTKPADAEVAIRNITAKWSEEEMSSTLKRIDVTVRPGELLTIVGGVGSGKSSILMTILGEIPITSGKVGVKGRVSYASQEPWTFAGTIKDNILFGSEFDEEKFKTVVHVCALERDMKLFPYGDQTIIGDRGVSLSGGQRARINLARSLYCDADIYLLDDPLSAVDASVAKHIFEKSIKGYLKEKIVILVTHQLQFIKAATTIMILENGEMSSLGSYASLLGKGIDLIKVSGHALAEAADTPRKESVRSRSASMSSQVMPIANDPLGSSMALASEEVYDDGNYEGGAQDGRETSENAAASAGARAYWVYIKSGAGPVILPVMVVIFVITQALFTGNDWWLSLWTDSQEVNFEAAHASLNDTNGTQLQLVHTSFVDDYSFDENVYVYALQIAALFILSNTRTLLYFIMCMRASVTLHDNLFKAVVRAPISFFDMNPIGRLLNRCSRDMGIIDDVLPSTVFDAIGILISDLGIAIMLVGLDWTIILPTIVMLIIVFFIRKLYIRTGRNIKKLEGITRSPVFSHISTSLYGLVTLRASVHSKDLSNSSMLIKTATVRLGSCIWLRHDGFAPS
ncbi:ATP-binding cassette sub-family C member 4 [Halotydeus destructor]|nr:ATP-binding cassette sub-family C member 4 [Halotydeus destructor]